ncbi:hypothetical protein YB2330_001868 [Saitoella coloradoensis]
MIPHQYSDYMPAQPSGSIPPSYLQQQGHQSQYAPQQPHQQQGQSAPRYGEGATDSESDDDGEGDEFNEDEEEEAFARPSRMAEDRPSSTYPQMNPAPLYRQQQQPTLANNPNIPGFYSSSGFDLLGVLARVITRPNPQIQLGPIDMSCSFVVTDARTDDNTICYISPSFEGLTGYTGKEILARNCRFLQSPEGRINPQERRKHTDNNAITLLKIAQNQGKEAQVSLINYKKGGQPFVNLLTVIPVTWENPNEIAFFVGFQVDLVEQPNAILETLKDGTYTVNYRMSTLPAQISPPGPDPQDVQEVEDDDEQEQLQPQLPAGSAAPSLQEILQPPAQRKQDLAAHILAKYLLDNAPAVIYVVSLKGIILYCSQSAAELLEHEAEDLVGKQFSSICHPSDIVPVMREIKNSTNPATSHVSLVFRLMRKHNGFMWFESEGHLHIEPGSKNRKYVCLLGKETRIYDLKWRNVLTAPPTQSAATPQEFWLKVSYGGIVLSATSTVKAILGGMSSDEMVGATVFRLVAQESQLLVRSALDTVRSMRDQVTDVVIGMQDKLGNVIHLTWTFFSGDVPSSANGFDSTYVLVNARRVQGSPSVHTLSFGPSIPQLSSHPSTGSSPTSSGPSGITQRTSPSAEHNMDANIFDELDTTRSSSWQYELHQLKVTNKRLNQLVEDALARR